MNYCLQIRFKYHAEMNDLIWKCCVPVCTFNFFGVFHCPKKSPALFGASGVFTAMSDAVMLEFSPSFSEMCSIASLKPRGILFTVNAVLQGK